MSDKIKYKQIYSLVPVKKSKLSGIRRFMYTNIKIGFSSNERKILKNFFEWLTGKKRVDRKYWLPEAK